MRPVLCIVSLRFSELAAGGGGYAVEAHARAAILTDNTNQGPGHGRQGRSETGAARRELFHSDEKFASSLDCKQNKKKESSGWH